MIAHDLSRTEPRRAWSRGEKSLVLLSICLAFVALELVGGSGWPFACLMGVYVAVTAFSIWCNGGFNGVFGLAVFWQAFQTVLVSQVARVSLGKNPETRFDAAIPTILCEILVTLGYGLAGLVASRINLNRGKPLFPPITDLGALQRLAIASTVLSVVRLLFTGVLGAGSGPLHVLDAFDPLAVGSAIGCAVIQSGGRKMFNPLVVYVAGPIIFFSLLGGGRGGLFSVTSSILLSSWLFGYRFRPHHALMGVVGLLMMVFVISPYSLENRARPQRPTLMENINESMDLMGDIVEDPIKHQFASKHQQDELLDIYKRQDYYELPLGNAGNVLNRFGLVRVQDMIIADVLKNGTTGFANITPAFDYVLPSFLSPNKGYQYWATGNALSHRIEGLVLPDDHTTGIVIGMAPDAFSAFGWLGAFLLPFGGFLFLILVVKLIASLNMWQNVFGIAASLVFSVRLSEGTLSTFVQGPIYNCMLLTVAFYVATRLSNLLDFRYLRPKNVPNPRVDGESGVIL